MTSAQPLYRAVIGFAVVALLAAACGSGSAPSTAPTAPPAAAATVSPAAPASTPAATPAVSASPAAAGSPGADPTTSLSIAAPYTLGPLEGTQADQFETSLRSTLGAMGSIVQVGARQVKKAGANDGLLLAMAFPGVPVPGSFLDTFAAGAGGSDATVSSTRIEGQDVKLIEGASSHVAAYAHGSTMVFAYGQSAAETVAIITAVIQASE